MKDFFEDLGTKLTNRSLFSVRHSFIHLAKNFVSCKNKAHRYPLSRYMIAFGRRTIIVEEDIH